MADTSPKDFSTTAASNGTVGGVNIAEGSQAAQLNNALRAVLAVIANPDFGVGTLFKVDTISESTADEGVTIDGLLIKDGALPAITAASVPGLVFADVGDVKATIRSTSPTGWLLLNGDSIGSAASAADQASDDYEDLFGYFWDSMADTEAAVSGGRGASAAADWAANKTLTMPDARGRAIIGSGTGATLTARTHGDTGGAEDHTLTAAQMPSHAHAITKERKFGSNQGGNPGWGNDVGDAGNATFTTTTAGSGDAHNNMQPWLALNWIVKY